jgi:hypothetical protein
MRIRLAAILGVLLALLPGQALAQEPDSGFILRASGDAAVAAGESADAVIVIDGNATIDGTVNDFLLVIDGDAIISGEARGNITVIDGRLILRSGSTIEDANLIDSSLEREDGATVTGDIDESADLAFGGIGTALSIIFWVGWTVIALAAALLAAAVAGRQLRRAALALTEELPQAILGAVVVWIGLPILAFLVLFTVVGIPLGIAAFLLLPLLWLLGYIVTGTRLGIWLTGLMQRPASDHPYLAAFLGVLALQLIGLIPVLGWIVVAVAGLWGAGAIALLAWRAFRGKSEEPAAAVSTEV